MRSCRTSVILAGKCHDHKSRHSNPSFRENVGSGENKSYQVLGIFISFSDRDRGWLYLPNYQLMNDGQQRKPGNHYFPLLLITCRGFLNRSSGAGVGVGKGSPREFLGGVPPSSPNPDPISDQKMSFSTSVFRPGSGCSNAILRINWVLTFNTIQRKTN